jgi:predicted membrane protein
METDSQNKNLFKRGRNKGKTEGIGFAILLILFGGVFLLFNLDIIPAIYKPVFISWQMLLILIGIWSLVVRKNYIWGLFLIGIGAFFIYHTLSIAFPEYFVDFNIDFKRYWPIIPIVLGILLVICSPICKCNNCKKRHKEYDTETYTRKDQEQTIHNSADFFEKNMIFGKCEQFVLSQNFKGGEVNVIFGELILDLHKATLAEKIARLELNTIFGNLIVYVPNDWRVEIDSSAILGTIQDKRLQKDILPESDDAVRLLIEANTIFGNIEIYTPQNKEYKERDVVNDGKPLLVNE